MWIGGSETTGLGPGSGDPTSYRLYVCAFDFFESKIHQVPLWDLRAREGFRGMPPLEVGLGCPSPSRRGGLVGGLVGTTHPPDLAF